MAKTPEELAKNCEKFAKYRGKTSNRKKSGKSGILGWTPPMDQPITRPRCPAGQRPTGETDLLVSAGRYLKM